MFSFLWTTVLRVDDIQNVYYFIVVIFCTSYVTNMEYLLLSFLVILPCCEMRYVARIFSLYNMCTSYTTTRGQRPWRTSLGSDMEYDRSILVHFIYIESIFEDSISYILLSCCDRYCIQVQIHNKIWYHKFTPLIS